MNGAVLAGGRSRRMGTPKALLSLEGRPLIAYVIDALAAVCPSVTVVAKADSPLPALEVEVWHEPAEPRHPAVGVLSALERDGGEAMLVCPVDLPLITPGELESLIAAHDGGAATLAELGGRLQPLCGVWGAGAAPALRAAGPSDSLAEIARQLGARGVARPDPAPYLNVNTPADLALARIAIRR